MFHYYMPLRLSGCDSTAVTLLRKCANLCEAELARIGSDAIEPVRMKQLLLWKPIRLRTGVIFQYENHHLDSLKRTLILVVEATILFVFSNFLIIRNTVHKTHKSEYRCRNPATENCNASNVKSQKTLTYGGL